MSTQGILLLDLIGFVLAMLIINLVRTRRLHVAYAVIWLVAIALMMVIISVPPLLQFITVAVGAIYPASAMTLLAFVLVFSMLIVFSVQLSTIATRQIEMAQAFALDELKARERQSGGNEPGE
jgi:hypothetical protein